MMRDCGSDFNGYPIFYFATIHLQEVSYQYPWLVTAVFFHMYISSRDVYQNALPLKVFRLLKSPSLFLSGWNSETRNWTWSWPQILPLTKSQFANDAHFYVMDASEIIHILHNVNTLSKIIHYRLAAKSNR